jgi:hypothetical protein
MGFFKRSHARLNQADRIRAKVLQSVDRFSSGPGSTVTVHLGQEDLGMFGSFELMAQVAVDTLQEAGHTVLNVNTEPWSSSVIVTVRIGGGPAAIPARGDPGMFNAMEYINKGLPNWGVDGRVCGWQVYPASLGRTASLGVAAVIPGEADVLLYRETDEFENMSKVIVMHSEWRRHSEWTGISVPIFNQSSWAEARVDTKWILCPPYFV